VKVSEVLQKLKKKKCSRKKNHLAVEQNQKRSPKQQPKNQKEEMELENAVSQVPRKQGAARTMNLPQREEHAHEHARPR